MKVHGSNKTQISKSMHNLENATEIAMVAIWDETEERGQSAGGTEVGCTPSTCVQTLITESCAG